MKRAVVLVALLCSLAHGGRIVSNDISVASTETRANDDLNCSLSSNLVAEIRSYAPLVDRISKFVLDGSFKGALYNELSEYIDLFGSRLAGTQNLENAIDYTVAQAQSYGLDDVHTEAFNFTAWHRNQESVTMLVPRVQDLKMLGLGYSVGTPAGGVTAEAVVVKDWDDLKAKADAGLVQGKIVVYNPEWVSYPVTVDYRVNGASRAGEFGAVAALVRSVTPFSLDTPHTGGQVYTNVNGSQIPVACITVEDAAMLERMQTRGWKIVLNVNMSATNVPNAVSRNTVVRINGTENPEQKVLVSGHMDSWDVGQGAMDDGAGAYVSWYALRVMKELGLQPRRTVQAVLWSAEELGYKGAQAYYQVHKGDLANYVLAMESDIGTFSPTGLSFSGSNDAACIVQEILKLLDNINATQLTMPAEGSDIDVFGGDNVPLGSLSTDNEKYFWYHHSVGDRMEIENPDELDRCLVLWTVSTFVVANLTEPLPREH